MEAPVELPNDDPDFTRGSRGILRMFSLYGVAFGGLVVLFVVASSGRVPVEALFLLGVILVLVLATAILVPGSLRSQREATPVRLLLYADRVVGVYDSSGKDPATPTEGTIPFSAVSRIWPGSFGGGREKFWVPAGVRADYARVATVDPASVRELVRGPPVPPGCVRTIALATRNFEPVRAAYLRRYPAARLFPDGSVGPPSEA